MNSWLNEIMDISCGQFLVLCLLVFFAGMFVCWLARFGEGNDKKSKKQKAKRRVDYIKCQKMRGKY